MIARFAAQVWNRKEDSYDLPVERDPDFLPGLTNPASDNMEISSDAPASSQTDLMTEVKALQSKGFGNCSHAEKGRFMRLVMAGCLPAECLHPRFAGLRGYEVARKCLDEQKDVTVVGWCRIKGGASNKTTAGGAIQLSWNTANHFASSNMVTLWACRGLKADVTRPLDPADFEGLGYDSTNEPGLFAPYTNDSSHLCQHCHCITWEGGGHVVAETHTLNEDRKGCTGWTPCPAECRQCGGKKVVVHCPHWPRCVVFHPGYKDLDDFKKRGICRDVGDHSYQVLVGRQHTNWTVGVKPADQHLDRMRPPCT